MSIPIATPIPTPTPTPIPISIPIPIPISIPISIPIPTPIPTPIPAPIPIPIPIPLPIPIPIPIPVPVHVPIPLYILVTYAAVAGEPGASDSTAVAGAVPPGSVIHATVLLSSQLPVLTAFYVFWQDFYVDFTILKIYRTVR